MDPDAYIVTNAHVVAGGAAGPCSSKAQIKSGEVMEPMWLEEEHAAMRHFSQKRSQLRKRRVCGIGDCAQVVDSSSAQTPDRINLIPLR